MKSLVVNEPFNMAYQDVAVPEIADNEVLLKIEAVGICGTDIHAYAGRQPFFSYPRVLGHEICGVVKKSGTQCKSKVGQRMVVIPCVACGECAACKEGKTNCCETVQLYGVHRSGGFQEYLAVLESNLVAVPESVSSEAASLIECFGIGAHSVRRAQVSAGENVLVVGAGPIGIGTAAVAKASGANVLVADIESSRREHVQEKLNLPAVNPLDDDYEAQIRKAFGGELACTVMDATGNERSMTGSVNFIRHGGKLVFIGLYIGELKLDDPTFHKKETTLIASRNATREDFERVIELMAAGELTDQLMVNRYFKFETVGLDYEASVVNEKAMVKGVIQFS
jgi:2-desacetyl-2-hydroxyethyl bacteriochlorophyllide A dehydrogenase